MGNFFKEHKGVGADIKATRPENENISGNEKAHTKIPMPSNQEGPRNEPSHSGRRADDR